MTQTFLTTAMDDLDTCTICMETYGEEVRPRSLHCGHTLCTACIDNKIEDGNLVCPYCQRHHSANSATDFSINYTTEALIARFRETQLDMKLKTATNPDNQQSGSRSLKSRAKAVINEQIKLLQKLLNDCESMKTDIHNYKGFLHERKVEHEELDCQISQILHQNKEIIKLIISEDKKVTDVLSAVRRHQQVARKNLLKYENLTQTTEIEQASEELEKVFDALDDWREKCNTQMPSVETIQRSGKILREMKAHFHTVSKDAGLVPPEAMSELPQCGLTVMDKVNFLKESSLKVERFQTMTEATKNMLLETDQLYAVQKKDGQVRSAKMSYRDGKTYLHHLQDSAPPPEALTIQQSQLIESLKTDNLIVFLDIEWGSSVKGRIHINLSPDTPFSRHFRVLCTGDLGPTYARSRLLKVNHKGNVTNENIRGGDYENDDGTGGAPLFAGLNPRDKVYNRNYVKGSLFVGYHGNDGSKSAQFTIILGNGVGNHADGIYGQVQDGMEILKSAIQQEDIKNVRIHDCGVVLPM